MSKKAPQSIPPRRRAHKIPTASPSKKSPPAAQQAVSRHWKRPSWRWVVVMVLVVGLMLLWTWGAKQAWSLHAAQIDERRADITQLTKQTFAGDADSFDDQTLITYQGELRERADRFCQTSWLATSYAWLAADARAERRDCRRAQDAYRQLLSAAEPVVEYQQADRALQQEIETAARQPSEQSWRKASTQLGSLEVPESYQPIIEAAREAAESLADAYAARALADKAQNHHEYDDAIIDLRNAHAALGRVADQAAAVEAESMQRFAQLVGESATAQ